MKIIQSEAAANRSFADELGGRKLKESVQRAASHPILRLVTLIVGVSLLQLALFASASLSEDSYSGACLLLAWLTTPKGALVGLVLAVCLALTWGLRWEELREEDSSHAFFAIRALVFVSAFLMAWPLITSPYNFYLNSWYGWDRTLMLLCLLVLGMRPAAVIGLALLAAIFHAQFTVPMGGSSWAMLGFPLKMLLLFVVLLLIRRVTSSWAYQEFFWATLLVAGAHYWHPGLAKVQMGWLAHDQIAYLIPSTYTNSWLGWVEQDTIADLTLALEQLNLPLKLFVLVVEFGVFLIIFHPRAVAAWSAGWIIFHSGICALTGIFLWPWIVLDATILSLALTYPQLWRVKGTVKWVSLALLFSSPWWSGTSPLSWFDSRANYTYRCIGIGESGQQYPIPPHRFAPFEYQFTLGQLSFLCEEPTLPITWGATDLETARALESCPGIPELLTLEKERGRSRFDVAAQAKCVAVLERFMLNSPTPPLWLAPPYLLTYSPPGSYRGQEPLVRIEVEQVLSFWDGANYLELPGRDLITVERPE